MPALKAPAKDAREVVTIYYTAPAKPLPYRRYKGIISGRHWEWTSISKIIKPCLKAEGIWNRAYLGGTCPETKQPTFTLDVPATRAAEVRTIVNGLSDWRA